MSDLNSFLAEESGVDTTPPETEDFTPEVPEPEAIDVEFTKTTEPETPEPETPPEGLDKRGEAIWREERTRRKELQAQVEKMNERWQQMVERMQQGQVAQSKPDQETAPQQSVPTEIPDFEDDPIGHLRAKNELMERQLAEVQEERQRTQAQNTQMQQFRQVQQNVDQIEAQFAAMTPDYNEAVGYLYENVRRMAGAMGYPPEQVEAAVAQTAMDISVRSLQQGKNPAQAAYEAAKAMGWAGSQQAAPGNKQKAPTSLSSVAGKRTTPGTPSWDAISEMDDKEFSAFWADMEKSARRGK